MSKLVLTPVNFAVQSIFHNRIMLGFISGSLSLVIREKKRTKTILLGLMVIFATMPGYQGADASPFSFLRDATDIIFVPPSLGEKFAHDPVRQYYQLERENKAISPNLGAVPPRPKLSSEAAKIAEKNQLRYQRDVLWHENTGLNGQNDRESLPSEANTGNLGFARKPDPLDREMDGDPIASPNRMQSVNDGLLPMGNDHFMGMPFDQDSFARTEFMETESPREIIATPSLANHPNSLDEKGRANAANLRDRLSERLQPLVIDQDFLASSAPKSADITPPRSNSGAKKGEIPPQTGVINPAMLPPNPPRFDGSDRLSSDQLAKIYALRIKLAVLIFDNNTDELTKDTASVLVKVAAYQKKERIYLYLSYNGEENDPLLKTRLTRIRNFLIERDVPTHVIVNENSSAAQTVKPLKIAPNQIIIFGLPIAENQNKG